MKGRKDVDGEPWLGCFSALTTESSQLELAVSGQPLLDAELWFCWTHSSDIYGLKTES